MIKTDITAITEVNNWGRNTMQVPQGVVIHIMDGYFWGSVSWFRNPKSGSSTHFLVAKDGTTGRCLQDDTASWGQGKPTPINKQDYQLAKIIRDNPNTNPNFYLFGIEHEGSSGDTFTDIQVEKSAKLIIDIFNEYAIPFDNVEYRIIPHSSIDYINRKNCPGIDNLNLIINKVKQLTNSNTSNMSNNNNNSEIYSVIVQKGWGLSNVAFDAGLPTEESTYSAIALLNGSDNWNQFNKKLKVGQEVIVRQKPVAKADITQSELDSLKAQVNDLSNQINVISQQKTDITNDRNNIANQYNDSQAKMNQYAIDLEIARNEAKKKIEVANSTINQMTLAMNDLNEKIAKKDENLALFESQKIELEKIYTDKINQLKKDGIFVELTPYQELVWGSIANGIVDELSSRGFKEGYSSWIDRSFKSQIVRSFFKYDWVWVVFSLLVWLQLQLQVIDLSQFSQLSFLQPIMPIIITAIGFLIKFMLTNYDKNKDGKVDKSDVTYN